MIIRSILLWVETRAGSSCWVPFANINTS